MPELYFYTETFVIAFIRKLFKIYDLDYVVNFSAESHVDKNIEDPSAFIKIKVFGT